MGKSSNINILQVLWHAMLLKCPFCYNGDLFQSYLKVSKCCNVCGQSFEKSDTGDGPAFFVMSVIGIIAAIVMITIEILYTPSFWVHVLLQVVIILGGSLVLLPIFKSLLIHLQYHFDAIESYQNKQ